MLIFMHSNDKMEKLVGLLARRGFIFPSGEIYGAFAGFFDFGHYGTLLKRRIEESWWEFFVTRREDVVGLEGSIISSPQIWGASGHLREFTDPLVECGKCHSRFRADQLIEDELRISVDGMSLDAINALISEHKLKCAKCKGDLEVAKPFNLMFKTHVGASEDESAAAYLRPETAQMIFTNFRQMQLISRKQLPFGIAQIGKAFRNEISPRNFVFRCREFTQMEIEYFINPDKMQECPILEKEDLSLEIAVLTATMQDKRQTEGKIFKFKDLVERKVIGTKWHAYLVLISYKWFLSLGLKPSNLRLREHVKAELSHYSSETWDMEYRYPWGWKELAGIANRGDFDLKQHMLASKKDLSYFDEGSKTKLLPSVIEPSFGLERAMLTLLLDAFEEKVEAKPARKPDGVPSTTGAGKETKASESGADSPSQLSQSTIVEKIAPLSQNAAGNPPQDNKASPASMEEKKNILHLAPAISPVQAAVFPLMKKDGLAEKAREVFQLLKPVFSVEYDESGSIGRRYARQDEIGTPYCITIDYDTLKDGTVTLRERDSARQKRINISECASILQGMLKRNGFQGI
ncbi:MAG TPA: glycine--tRNA ligase [Candidatus Norongarragalinales archaeon]|nr:glycine--tRNA ligase [Candidatus Norongarragalinales archaeon]